MQNKSNAESFSESFLHYLCSVLSDLLSVIVDIPYFGASRLFNTGLTVFTCMFLV